MYYTMEQTTAYAHVQCIEKDSEHSVKDMYSSYTQQSCGNMILKLDSLLLRTHGLHSPQHFQSLFQLSHTLAEWLFSGTTFT